MVSYPIFELRKFINPILDELAEGENKDCCTIFDKHFQELVKNFNLEVILNRYCSSREIKSAKYRYCCDYIEKKLNIVLFQKVLKAIEKQHQKIKK
jgi:hypothetical protein